MIAYHVGALDERNHFARFLALLDGEQRFRPELLAAFTAKLNPGWP